MKMLIISFVIPFLFIFSSYVPCYSDEYDTCKENIEQICNEYENFLTFLFSDKKKKISLDFEDVPFHMVTEDGSENDPLCDAFYEGD